MRPTSEAISKSDKTIVGGDSSFALEIARILAEPKIGNVIETGTFKGTGTTRILLMKRQPGTIIYSIEVNPSNHQTAKSNLKDFFDLKLLLGNTLPKSLIPSSDMIRQYMKRHEPLNIYCDYDTVSSDKLVSGYCKEIAHNVPNDMLGNALKKCALRPGLVLLDSAGHIGFIEFLYTIYMLRSSCYIALDDVNHVKHYDSFKFAMSKPSMFSFVNSKNEKTGWAIIKYLYSDKSICNMSFENFCAFCKDIYINGVSPDSRDTKGCQSLCTEPEAKDLDSEPAEEKVV